MADRSAKQKYDERLLLAGCWIVFGSFALEMGERWHDTSWHFWALVGWLLLSLSTAITFTVRQRRAVQRERQS